MSNETMVTIQGWVANEPKLRQTSGGPVLNFRVGSTPRHFRRASGEWVNGETQWYAVSAWRNLAVNGDRSIRRGDPVVIHGRLQHRTYSTRDGAQGLSLEIDAITIGHDLGWGSAQFRKETKTQQEPRETQQATGVAPSTEPPADDPWLPKEERVEEPVGVNAA